MSTHIYFQLEISGTKNLPRLRWGHFARIDLPQDYLLFSVLAGVRRDDFVDRAFACQAPKGLPGDVTEETLRYDALNIDEEAANLDVMGYCSRAAAEEWVKAGRSRYLDDGYAVTHPDFHSHSWATSEELECAQRIYENEGGTFGALLGAVIAMMNSLQRSDFLARAVFWFE